MLIIKKEISTINELLGELGVPSNIKGFAFIKYALSLIEEKRVDYYCTAITKVLYPEIAKKFNTTSSRVERAIRHAIDIAWLRGNLELQKYLFRWSIDPEKGRPTNAEFIATLGYYLEEIKSSNEVAEVS